MNHGFWDKLPRPFLSLAPMYDVTDSAFRQVIVRRGRPDVFYTEFVSADGLSSIAKDKLVREFYFTESERPIVAQIFGSRPENIRQAAAIAQSLGFDGLDINMGCPDAAVQKQGAGACLINSPSLAQEIIAAARAGAPELPLSIKTRIGYNKIEFEKWLPELIKAKPDHITVHLRTKKEMSLVPAHWELMPEIKKLFVGSDVLLSANGDVRDTGEARHKALEYGLDGVMLGRAVFGNPCLFTDYLPTKEDKLKALIEHINLFAELYLPGVSNDKLFSGHTKSFAVMKKHFKAYVSGFPGAGDIREKLYAVDSPTEACAIIESCLK